jgi:meso-butanediol dehydrogenase/(S,S)-butanediol dehydrogenase/diacetyl reductase
MARFAGSVVVITGAGAGIGEATARRFAQEGAHVVLADIDGDRAGRAATQIAAEADATVVPVTADAGRQEDCERVVAEAVDRFGRLDTVVNNAGYGVFGDVTELAPEEWREIMAVDLDSVFFTSRAAIPHLMKTGGSIVNLCSVSGLYADYGLVAYNVAKAAVANLTRGMAIDHAADGVRVNAVCPGPIGSPTVRRLIDQPRFAQAFADAIPMGRIGQPHEVAALIVFLASSDASYITGANVVVDGGLTAATGQPNLRRMGVGRARTNEVDTDL